MTFSPVIFSECNRLITSPEVSRRCHSFDPQIQAPSAGDPRPTRKPAQVCLGSGGSLFRKNIFRWAIKDARITMTEDENTDGRAPAEVAGGQLAAGLRNR